MKRIKKFISYLIIISFTAVVINAYEEPISVYADRMIHFSFCEEPVKYKIGTIDSRFDINREKFEELSKRGAELWNSNYPTTLFMYNPQASLTLNLVYDERQSLIKKIDTATSQVDLQKKKLTQGLDNFEKKKEELSERIETLNKQIEYWNGQGGAPIEEYEKIKKQQREIQREVDELNKEAELLNKNTNELNTGINSLNNNVNNFNTLLETKPEEGLYIPLENRINIYIFSDENQLTNTIAHELGHALGLGHIQTQSALMNPVATEETKLTTDDLNLLIEHCKEQNKLLLLKNDFKYLIEYQIKKFNEERN